MGSLRALSVVERCTMSTDSIRRCSNKRGEMNGSDVSGLRANSRPKCARLNEAAPEAGATMPESNRGVSPVTGYPFGPLVSIQRPVPTHSF